MFKFELKDKVYLKIEFVENSEKKCFLILEDFSLFLPNFALELKFSFLIANIFLFQK